MLAPRSLRTSLGALALCAVSPLLSSCQSICDRNPDEPPVKYTGGITDAEHGFYESSPVEGPFLDFPPGRTYRLVHGLGGVPQVVDVWFSFDERPLEGTNPSGAVKGAGNQATLEHVTSEYIDIRNDTCSDVRIRVTAQDPDPARAGDGGP